MPIQIYFAFDNATKSTPPWRLISSNTTARSIISIRWSGDVMPADTMAFLYASCFGAHPTATKKTYPRGVSLSIRLNLESNEFTHAIKACRDSLSATELSALAGAIMTNDAIAITNSRAHRCTSGRSVRCVIAVSPPTREGDCSPRWRPADCRRAPRLSLRRRPRIHIEAGDRRRGKRRREACASECGSHRRVERIWRRSRAIRRRGSS